jgi:hypothetical protein
MLKDLSVAEDARRRGVGVGCCVPPMTTPCGLAQALYDQDGWRRDTAFLHSEHELPKGGG